MCCKNNLQKIKHTHSKLAGKKKGSIPWNKNKNFQEKNIRRLTETVESGNYKTHTDCSIRRLVRAYLIHKYGHKCMMCGLSEWTGLKIPLVSDHIDGNSKNNEISNFRIICNNCDATLPTFKGRNRGNGRKNRYKKLC